MLVDHLVEHITPHRAHLVGAHDGLRPTRRAHGGSREFASSQAQHGAEEGEAILASLSEQLKRVPTDAVGLFLAAQALPPDATPTELLVQALKERRRVAAVGSVGPTITDFVESMRPFEDVDGTGEPTVMMALSQRARRLFRRCLRHARVWRCGRRLRLPREPIRLEGEHFEVVTRCISNRCPEFTRALEEFLASTSGDESLEDGSLHPGGLHARHSKFSVARVAEHVDAEMYYTLRVPYACAHI